MYHKTIPNVLLNILKILEVESWYFGWNWWKYSSVKAHSLEPNSCVSLYSLKTSFSIAWKQVFGTYNYVYWHRNGKAHLGTSPGCALRLRCQYTYCTAFVGSNHYFHTIGMYRNWATFFIKDINQWSSCICFPMYALLIISPIANKRRQANTGFDNQLMPSQMVIDDSLIASVKPCKIHHIKRWPLACKWDAAVVCALIMVLLTHEYLQTCIICVENMT